MSNIFRFPTGEVIDNNNSDLDDTPLINNEIADSLSNLASEILECAEGYVEMTADDERWLDGFDIRNDDSAESRDAFVILNMIYALFARYRGLTHIVQSDLDSIYVKLKKQQEMNDDLT